MLLLATVVCGSNYSRRHDVTVTDTEHPACEYVAYPDHLPFAPDSLPSAARVRRLANDTAHSLAAWITNDIVDWKSVANKTKQLLEMNPEMAACTFAIPDQRLGVLTFHQGGKVAVLPLSRNGSAPTEKYWRDVTEVGGDGKWSMPFLDCLSGKWIYAYSVPLPKKNR